jgi:hypothetical protein
MWSTIKNTASAAYNSFHGSETILWSRFNMLLGSAWIAIQGQDVSPVLHDPKYILYYAVGSNFINETLRRRGATYDDDGKLV